MRKFITIIAAALLTAASFAQEQPKKTTKDYNGTWDGAVCIQTEDGPLPWFSRLIIDGASATHITSGTTNTVTTEAVQVVVLDNGDLGLKFTRDPDLLLGFRLPTPVKNKINGAAVMGKGGTIYGPYKAPFEKSVGTLEDYQGNHPNICKDPSDTNGPKS